MPDWLQAILVMVMYIAFVGALLGFTHLFLKAFDEEYKK